jgi:cytochrome c oxidase subunit 2
VNPSPSPLRPVSPQAANIATVWWVLLAVAALVFVAVGGFIWFALATHRRDNPRRWSDDRFVVVGGIVVPAILLAGVGVLTVVSTRNLFAAAASRPLRVEVTGRQWWWEVHYPGLGIVTANEIHVPTGQPVTITIDAADVIHSFWVPQVAGKLDAIPGQTNHLTFRVDHAGTYWGQCAEFCGLQHSHMAVVLDAVSPDRFRSWVAAHSGPPPAPTGEAARGEALFVNGTCAGCHTIAATPARGTAGPDLTDFGERHTIGAGAIFNDADGLRRWLQDTQREKPGSKMPTIDLSDDDIDALVAYLQGLR